MVRQRYLSHKAENTFFILFHSLARSLHKSKSEEIANRIVEPHSMDYVNHTLFGFLGLRGKEPLDLRNCVLNNCSDLELFKLLKAVDIQCFQERFYLPLLKLW